MSNEVAEPGTWTRRRRFMYVVSAFCMLVIGFVVGTGMVTSAGEVAVTMGFLCLISVTGSYVFGATWDDQNARKK